MSMLRLLLQRPAALEQMKDAAGKRHACLIPWDELDKLSEMENALTGKKPDYKQMDRDNITTVYGIMYP